jgi:hypothetical protein
VVFQSVAVAVAHRAPSVFRIGRAGPGFCPPAFVPYALAVAVGHNENSASKVRGSDVGSRKRDGAGSVSELAQLRPYRGQPATLAARDVFDDDEAGAHLSDDARELVPEAASGATEADALSCPADVGAGKSSANNVNWRQSRDGADIGVPHGVWPVASEHGAAVRIDLDLPDHGAEAGALEAKIQAADSCE